MRAAGGKEVLIKGIRPKKEREICRQKNHFVGLREEKSRQKTIIKGRHFRGYGAETWSERGRWEYFESILQVREPGDIGLCKGGGLRKGGPQEGRAGKGSGVKEVGYRKRQGNVNKENGDRSSDLTPGQKTGAGQRTKEDRGGLR